MSSHQPVGATGTGVAGGGSSVGGGGSVAVGGGGSVAVGGSSVGGGGSVTVGGAAVGGGTVGECVAVGTNFAVATASGRGSV